MPEDLNFFLWRVEARCRTFFTLVNFKEYGLYFKYRNIKTSMCQIALLLKNGLDDFTTRLSNVRDA